ncbi:unnamed protein product [Protopolystoma xenopodis]|uniref:Uncharacterized protein n=1 Tax=Protopolystoma xenopodis TaxID=117903 RepID=A0A448X7H8_9PLAT|nr:unnamed protein product [Protopolystoma xenopodis]
MHFVVLPFVLPYSVIFSFHFALLLPNCHFQTKSLTSSYDFAYFSVGPVGSASGHCWPPPRTSNCPTTESANDMINDCSPHLTSPQHRPQQQQLILQQQLNQSQHGSVPMVSSHAVYSQQLSQASSPHHSQLHHSHHQHMHAQSQQHQQHRQQLPYRQIHQAPVQASANPRQLRTVHQLNQSTSHNHPHHMNTINANVNNSSHGLGQLGTSGPRTSEPCHYTHLPGIGRIPTGPLSHEGDWHLSRSHH